MVDMDKVNPENKIDFLNAAIRNFEEMLDEITNGLRIANDKKLTFVKTGEMNTSHYDAVKQMIIDLDKEYEFYKTKLIELRKERAAL